MTTARGTVVLSGRTIEYRVIASGAARRLSLRVGPNGVEVIRPASRRAADLTPLFARHARWLLRQLDRIARLRATFPPTQTSSDEILFRGVPTRVRVAVAARHRGRRSGDVLATKDGLVVVCRDAAAAPARVLEGWLRQQAHRAIESELPRIAAELRIAPRRVSIRSQRTLWGSCSSRGTLSFNWRCVLAPEDVLRYLVTHEAAHLVVPNHSGRFWQMVTRLCPHADHARRWLTANGHHLMVDLPTLLTRASPPTA